MRRVNEHVRGEIGIVLQDVETGIAVIVSRDVMERSPDHGREAGYRLLSRSVDRAAAVDLLGKQALSRIVELARDRDERGLDDRAAAKMIDDIAFAAERLQGAAPAVPPHGLGPVDILETVDITARSVEAGVRQIQAFLQVAFRDDPRAVAADIRIQIRGNR